MAVYTTIDDPEAYFQTVIWTGNGSDDRAITLPGDTNMQPDLVWVKGRTDTYRNALFDAARGATKYVESDTNTAEQTGATFLKSFTSDGFTLGTGGRVNANTETYAAWCWNTQGGSGSSNTDGSINTTTTSVGQTQGFSIITYTGNGTAGATIGHGLGSVPKMLIVKRKNDTGNWGVYHESIGNTLRLYLQDESATSDGNWNNTTPTSSVFTIDDGAVVNSSSDTYIAYCFAEKQGYSKFGVYSGNGNADGPFIFCSFRPAFVLCKRTDAADFYWNIIDNKRNTYNPVGKALFPNVDEVENDYTNFADFYSNGFKIRHTSNGSNNSSGTYIYMAFAEAPFVNSNGVPCNAR